MAISNSDIAALFRKLADLLDIEGTNPFRIRAYRQAALVIDTLPRPVADMVANGEDLTQLRGIGKAIAQKITRIVQTGDFPKLDEVMERTPPVLTDLLQVPGLGPRKVEQLYETLGVETLSDLEAALRDGRAAALPGFGAKTVANLLAELEKLKTKGPEKRLPIIDADPITRLLLTHLNAFPGVIHVQMAGSFRRRKETVGDLDMVASAENGSGLIRHFCEFADVKRVELRGITRGTIILKSGLHVDLRVVNAQSYGTTLAYFTGSRAHTIFLRKMAVKKGWKLSEYGLFDKDQKSLAGPEEAGLYKAFGRDWIPPELREMHGELEAARHHRLPDLAQQKQILGDLHLRRADPGLDAQIKAAKALGYGWIGIADPLRSPACPKAQSPDDLRHQIATIDRLNAADPDFRILKSAAVEILKDGSLAIKDALLGQLDYVVCRIVTPQGLGEKAQTQRLIGAMDQATARGARLVIGQLTGRRNNQAPGWQVNFDEIIAAASQHSHLLEINQDPALLGLSETQCQRAIEKNVRIALGSGAAAPADLGRMKYALWQARRGWAQAADLANTRAWDQIFS